MRIMENEQKGERVHPFSLTSKTFFLSLMMGGILFFAVVSRNSDILLLNIFFLSYLVTGVFLVPERKGIRIFVKRETSQYEKDGIPGVEVSVSLQNRGDKPLAVSLTDSLPPGIRVTSGSPVLTTAIKPGGEEVLTYTFESLRGAYRWKDLYLEAEDPLGCVRSGILSPAGGEELIPPLYQKLRPFQIRPWRTLTAPGSLPSGISGNGTDFRGIRDYHPGDPLRALDWRLTAKYPHKFFTKEFEQEKAGDILFFLDGRFDLKLKRGEECLFEKGIQTVAALSDMFLHQGHRVGLNVLSEEVLHVPSGYGKKQLHRILGTLAEAETGNEESPSTLDCIPLSGLPVHATIIVFSPFHYEDISYYRILRSRGYQIFLICPDSFNFIPLPGTADALEKMALRVSIIERKLHLSLLTELSVFVIDWDMDEPLIPLVRNAFLAHKPIRKL